VRTQQRPSAPQRQETSQSQEQEDPFEERIQPKANGPVTGLSATGLPERGRGMTGRTQATYEAARPEQMTPTVLKPDAMQDSPLAAGDRHPQELDGIDEMPNTLNWVSLDSPRGLLICKNLDIEVTEFVGTILESRAVRVMKEGDGTVFCASSNRTVADVGRPGRECGPCEDREVNCFPRWWIAWREDRTNGERTNGERTSEENTGVDGQIFAHTLSQTGTLNFTRYVAKLRRDGLLPSQVQTRLFVEEARRQKTNTLYRRLQFERAEPFG
jgi:hypothetical protein